MADENYTRTVFIYSRVHDTINSGMPARSRFGGIVVFSKDSNMLAVGAYGYGKYMH